MEIMSANSQNVASTSTLTSGGLNAGTSETENAFYGYESGGQTRGRLERFLRTTLWNKKFKRLNGRLYGP